MVNVASDDDDLPRWKGWVESCLRQLSLKVTLWQFQVIFVSDIVSVHLQALYLFGPILELLSFEVSALVFLALHLPSSSQVRSYRSVQVELSRL
jgi:hypothetical protein